VVLMCIVIIMFGAYIEIHENNNHSNSYLFFVFCFFVFLIHIVKISHIKNKVCMNLKFNHVNILCKYLTFKIIAMSLLEKFLFLVVKD